MFLRGFCAQKHAFLCLKRQRLEERYTSRERGSEKVGTQGPGTRGVKDQGTIELYVEWTYNGNEM